MEVTQTSRNGALIFAVRGEIDGRTAPELHATVAPRVEADGAVLLDLSEVRYLSSAGLRVLLLLHRETRARRSRLVLVGLPEELRDTMALTGFDQHFTMAGTVEDGLAAAA